MPMGAGASAGAHRPAGPIASDRASCRRATWCSCSTCRARCSRPNKLPLVKQAFRALVQELRPEDRVAIVVYAGAAGPGAALHAGRATRRRSSTALDRLEAGGSTAGGAGLRLAYDVGHGSTSTRRATTGVILATDGDFNVGVSSDAEMVRLIEEQPRGRASSSPCSASAPGI